MQADNSSTTVEIILYYSTYEEIAENLESTTVEIILYYSTTRHIYVLNASTTVEIILYYSTALKTSNTRLIYNSRNYSILLN